MFETSSDSCYLFMFLIIITQFLFECVDFRVCVLIIGYGRSPYCFCDIEGVDDDAGDVVLVAR